MQAQQSWRMGLVAPRHVESSWTGDRNYILSIDGQIFNPLDHQRTCLYSLQKLFMYSGYKPFEVMCSVTVFTPSLWIVFVLPIGSLKEYKFFSLILIVNDIFFLMVCCSSAIFRKSLPTQV